MLKPNRRQLDNISIAYTKSSKTLKSKLNSNPQTQVKHPEPPYFKHDALREEMEDRAKKKGINIVRSTKPQESLKKAGKIVQQLQRRHQQAKQRLIRLKEDAADQKEEECPFQPKRKRFQKYIVGGNVIKRNELWLIQKKKKYLQQKQNIVSQDLTKCTFSPQLISKKKSQVYLRNRSISNINNASSPNVSKSKSKSNIGRSGEYQQLPQQKSKRSFVIENYQEGKRNLNNRIQNMGQD